MLSSVQALAGIQYGLAMHSKAFLHYTSKAAKSSIEEWLTHKYQSTYGHMMLFKMAQGWHHAVHT